MDLEFKIENQILKRKDEEVPVNKSRNYLYCHFEFLTEEWENVDKYAIFKNEDKESYSVFIGDDGVVKVPWQALTGVLNITLQNIRFKPCSLTRLRQPSKKK